MTFHAAGTISGAPEDLRPLIAAEDSALAELKREGAVTSALLSADRHQVFLVVEADDEPAARAQLDRLPLVRGEQLRFALQQVTAI
jgi:hypothetical protein